MSKNLIALTILIILFTGFSAFSQCNQTLAINSYSSTCDGMGESTVTVNVTVTFGNGNNSVTISYNYGAGEIYAVIIEDNGGDVTNQDYTFTVPSCTMASLTLTAWPNPSGGGSACSDPAPVVVQNVVPVTFGKVDCQKVEDGIRINWSTYSEVNNSHFVIERLSRNNEFIAIGDMQGTGDTNRQIQYSYMDATPQSGMNSYRIKQVDFDGTFSYSEIATIRNSNGSNLSFYPNPVSDVIYFEGPHSGNLQFLSAAGLLINEVNLDRAETLDVSFLKTGIYVVVDRQNGKATRLVKI